MGLLQAMNWMTDLHKENMIFEVDRKAILDVISQSTKDYLDFQCIISKCKNYLSDHTNSLVSFKRKQAKQVDHTLARASRFSLASTYFIIFQVVLFLLL